MMTNEPIHAFVFRDGEGASYLIPAEVLAHYKVRPERQADLEAIVGGGDVAGFWTPQPIPMPTGPTPEPRPWPWPDVPDLRDPRWHV